MKIGIAQLNPIVGDIPGNVARLKEALSSFQAPPDLLVFPELFLVGYPVNDLLLSRRFLDNTEEAIRAVCEESTRFPNTGILFGAPCRTGEQAGTGLYNAAYLVHNGRIRASAHKTLLPTYDVFDEARYFDPAKSLAVIGFKDEILGVSICEDAWNDQCVWDKRHYDIDPLQILASQGASLFINIAASPFQSGKPEIRYQLFKRRVERHGIPFLFVNQVGGNDELVFDGQSMYINRNGELAMALPAFEEHIAVIDTLASNAPLPYIILDEVESLFKALVLGLRDYVHKCGFSQVVIGLSGGIDSAVTSCIACGSLGKENVLGISMPSEYSSPGSVTDSNALAENLGISFLVAPISDIVKSYTTSLAGRFNGQGHGVTEENIQARIRGNILMAFSNEEGYLVLSTGNKSELAVGYCTLYGDMSGGLAVLSDVPKGMVYRLADYINRKQRIIPQPIIDKPPSAELRPNQRDQDSLPPYDILDKVISLYVDFGLSPEEIAGQGLDFSLVKWIIETIDKNEYKRRQAPPGLKVTGKAFGKGRRMPIAAKMVL
ncbi:MAG: NAD+ synthase [Pseudomonadota bacterium]